MYGVTTSITASSQPDYNHCDAESPSQVRTGLCNAFSFAIRHLSHLALYILKENSIVKVRLGIYYQQSVIL